MSLDESANPIIRTEGSSVQEWGLTKREHAAIALRVPESGNPDIDAMIRKAQRRDLAAMAMQGMIERGWDSGDVRGYEGWRVGEAVRYADALLAALDATNRKESA